MGKVQLQIEKNIEITTTLFLVISIVPVSHHKNEI